MTAAWIVVLVLAVAFAVRAIQRREARGRRSAFFGNRQGIDLTEENELALRRANPSPTVQRRAPGSSYPEMPK